MFEARQAPSFVALRINAHAGRYAGRVTNDPTGELTLESATGEVVPLSEFLDIPTVLVFFSPGCSACAELVPIARTWPNGLREGTDMQLVFFGTRAQFEASDEAYQPLLDVAWYDPVGATMRGLGVTATPGAVAIDEEHPLGVGACLGSGAIGQLIMQYSQVGGGPVTGTTTPAIVVPDISGKLGNA